MDTQLLADALEELKSVEDGTIIDKTSDDGKQDNGAYDKSQISNVIIDHTNGYEKENGIMKTAYYGEKELAKETLSKHYEKIYVTKDDDGNYEIVYSASKNNKKVKKDEKSNSSDADNTTARFKPKTSEDMLEALGSRASRASIEKILTSCFVNRKSVLFVGNYSRLPILDAILAWADHANFHENNIRVINVAQNRPSNSKFKPIGAFDSEPPFISRDRAMGDNGMIDFNKLSELIHMTHSQSLLVLFQVDYSSRYYDDNLFADTSWKTPKAFFVGIAFNINNVEGNILELFDYKVKIEDLPNSFFESKSSLRINESEGGTETISGMNIYKEMSKSALPEEIKKSGRDLLVKITDKTKEVITRYQDKLNVKSKNGWYTIPMGNPDFWKDNGKTKINK